MQWGIENWDLTSSKLVFFFFFFWGWEYAPLIAKS